MQTEPLSDPAPTLSNSPPPPPPPRPAPTAQYSWSEHNPAIQSLYIRNHKQANLELAKLGSGPQILGFDLEWKPNRFKGGAENPVALVQLSNYDTVFLLQISAMEEFPSQLAHVLENPSIVKAGVAIQGDAKKLYHDRQVSMYNCVDLSLLARTVDNARWTGGYTRSIGLARLIEIYEYRLLPKGRVTLSDWEAVLGHRQVEYASNDAHAGYTLYKKLESMIPLLQDPPNPVWYSFNSVAGRPTNSDGLPWFPNNPNYNPGPPEPTVPRPPRPPRQPKAADIIKIDTSQNGDFSNADNKDRNSQYSILTSQVGIRDLQEGQYSTLPSLPQYSARSERLKGFDGSTTASDASSARHATQFLPNKNRRYQQHRNTNRTDQGSRTTTTTSSTLPTQTSQTQANGAVPTHISPAQRPEQIATHPGGFPSGDSGGGNPRPRIPFNSGARTHKPRTNPNRARNDNRN